MFPFSKEPVPKLGYNLCLYVLSPSFLSDPDAPSAGPVAPPTVMSLRGVVRLSMLLAADRQDGDGEGEMTTPPAAPALTTLELTTLALT